MRRFAVFLVILTLLGPGAAAAQSMDAAALLALHHRYVGWQFGDGTFASMRESGNLVNTAPSPGASPQPSTPIRILIRGVAFRATQVDSDTGRPVNSGFTGHLFWESNENGFTHPIIGDEEKYEISFQFLFSEATTELTGALQNPVTIGGASYPVVRVTPGNGFPIDLAIDPRTGAYVRAVIDLSGRYETTIDILSYAQPLPGKRVISHYRYQDSHYTHEMTTFQPNVPIADDELHPPQQTATWTFANPNPFPIDARGNFILVPATVNGVPGTFLLDTGASVILLTSDFARRAHVRRAAGGAIYGIGGSASAETDVINSLVVGGNTLSNVIAMSSALGNDYRGLLGGAYNNERVDGLLGYDLLGGAFVRVNIGANTMTILDPSTADLSNERGAVLAVDLSSGQPTIPMTLDGSIAVNATLDTGDRAGVGYSRELVSKYHIAIMRGMAMIGGVGGGEITNCGAFGKLAIGPILYEGESACETSALTGTNLLVGIDFLKHFNLVFDYPRGQMALDPLP
ncbi:MAG: aspartyl protease family protein [Candidatus Tyrphobacter sp.]